jgi:hypothetical protein
VRFALEGAAPIDNPTRQEVEHGLRTLESAERDYAILERQAETYLQTAPNGDGAFLLEFRDGSDDRHFQARRPLPIDDVITAFGAYLDRDAGWRSRYEWERLDLTPPAPRPRRERRQTSRERALARDVAGLAWGLAQAVILAALLVAGGLAGGLASLVVPSSVYALPVVIGFAGGLVAGVVVNHSSRMWLLGLRLRRLRQRGQRVMATVEWVDRRLVANPRGPGTTIYTVFVHWSDPVDGTEHEYERQYRFWGTGSKRFETAVDEPHLAVLYARAHPSRFVIDIPFAPTAADFVLSERPGQVLSPAPRGPRSPGSPRGGRTASPPGAGGGRR